MKPILASLPDLEGKCLGMVKDNGLRSKNPFYSMRPVSQRVRTSESGQRNVNKLAGSPIEFSAVIVWQVTDGSQAVYIVDD